jgi:pimeloyl-ACP methyl ester carboxylesterase
MFSRIAVASWLLIFHLTLFAAAQAQTPHAYVLHLNGIGGERIMDRWLMRGLSQAGLNADYRIYDWTGDEAGMLALGDVKLHASESAKVAEMISDYRHAHPNDRIIITSHSAGAGIAAWALAQLPANVSIDTWIMLEPALSPKFDLSKALAHVTGKAYAFSSINDVIVLGAGTRLMGTVDRVNGDAAGLVGFSRPPNGDPAEYQKLISVPYDTSWMRFGNTGDHIGCMLRPFARNVIAPILIDGVVPKFPPLVPSTAPAPSN